MSREIKETPSNAAQIDLDRVVIDPFYRREVLSRLRSDRLHPRDKEEPATARPAEGEQR